MYRSLDLAREQPAPGVVPAGFRVQGSGFRVQGSEFRVQGPEFRVQGAGFRVQGSGCRVQGSGFRVVVQVLASDEVLLAAHAGPFASDETVVFRPRILILLCVSSGFENLSLPHHSRRKVACECDERPQKALRGGIPCSFLEPFARSWSHFVGIYRQNLTRSLEN